MTAALVEGGGALRNQPISAAVKFIQRGRATGSTAPGKISGYRKRKLGGPRII